MPLSTFLKTVKLDALAKTPEESITGQDDHWLTRLASWFYGRSGALFIGLICGLSLGVFLAHGGQDAFENFFVRPAPGLPNPNWIFLFTLPFGWIPAPFSLILWNILTILIARALHTFLGYRYWWMAVVGVPLFINLWLGNLEVLPIGGVLLGWLILQKRIHLAWWGVALLWLLNKPQVGLGLALLLSFWIYKDFGWRALLPGDVVALMLLVLSCVLWSGWIGRWLDVILHFKQDDLAINASIFPYGLAAWPFALYPKKVDRIKRLRMVAAATLLSSPYLTNYHNSTLFAISENYLAYGFSWILFLIGLVYKSVWGQFGWLLPAIILVVDFVGLLLRPKEPVQPEATLSA